MIMKFRIATHLKVFGLSLNRIGVVFVGGELVTGGYWPLVIVTLLLGVDSLQAVWSSFARNWFDTIETGMQSNISEDVGFFCFTIGAFFGWDTEVCLSQGASGGGFSPVLITWLSLSSSNQLWSNSSSESDMSGRGCFFDEDGPEILNSVVRN